MCEMLVEKSIFSRILQDIAIITKEKSRKWDPKANEDEVKTGGRTRSGTSKPSISSNNPAKKKGVGYDPGTSSSSTNVSSWKLNAKAEDKKIEQQYLRGLMKIITSMLGISEWEPSKRLYNMICESSLLPLIENSLRGGTLIEMGNQSQYYK